MVFSALEARSRTWSSQAELKAIVCVSHVADYPVIQGNAE